MFTPKDSRHGQLQRVPEGCQHRLSTERIDQKTSYVLQTGE